MSDTKTYQVAEGRRLTGAFVGDSTYEAGDTVELEPQYAEFYLAHGILEALSEPRVTAKITEKPQEK